MELVAAGRGGGGGIRVSWFSYQSQKRADMCSAHDFQFDKWKSALLPLSICIYLKEMS